VEEDKIKETQIIPKQIYKKRIIDRRPTIRSISQKALTASNVLKLKFDYNSTESIQAVKLIKTLALMNPIDICIHRISIKK
jgi:hypothetical protein